MKLLIALALFLSASAQAATISIDADPAGCANKQRQMSVAAIVEGQRFNFGGSCGLSFNSTFRTALGLSCGLAADLCTRRGGEIRLSCLDGSSTTLRLSCSK